MKDNFSSHSSEYARYRPGYPPELFEFLINTVRDKEIAWDCGTGNGQVAAELAKFFLKVDASDISRQQLENALEKPNINYSIQRAEKTNFPDDHFDLITVAQAIHWFDFEAFYAEVRRTLKPEGVLAVMGYGLFRSNDATDKVIKHFYEQIIGPYWDEERRYLEEEYKSIPFPFEELKTPQFEHRLQWSFEHLLGYLNSWSAVKHYEKAENRNPVALIEQELRKSFGNEGEVIFPILFRVGKL
ncbi:MAG: class I SAM-dependent methyltransferase [Salegentibacter sp.]